MLHNNLLSISVLLLFSHLPFIFASCTAFNSRNHSTCTILTNRTFLLHRPANYQSSSAHALVLSFHGRNGNSAQQETLSQFSDLGVLIDGKGIFAAYPQGLVGEGSETAWQGAPYAATGVDDITFALAVVTEVSSLYNIVPSRVYAAGKSNGGGFVNLLACTKKSAAVFAAFAPVSAALYPGTLSFSGCNPGRYIPLINSHGTADAIVPYAGKGSTEPDIMTWRQGWVVRNNCTGSSLTPKTSTPFKNTTEYAWDCLKVDVNGITGAGLGHSWPTTLGLDPAGAPENVAKFNMTAAFIIPFFNDNPLL